MALCIAPLSHPRLLPALLVLALLGLVGCHGRHNPTPVPSEVSATLGAGGGSLQGPDGVTLSIASGTLSGDTSFRIARSSVGAPTLTGVATASSIYEITPHGTPFETSALVKLPYDATKVPAGEKPFLLRAQPGGAWSVVAARDDGHALTADLPGLSWYAVGVGTPDSQGFSFGAGDCPPNHELRFEYLDGTGMALPVPRDASGFALPFLPDITAAQSLSLRVTWTRPAGVNRLDDVYLTIPNSPGIVSLTSPLSQSVNQQQFSRNYTITVDPSKLGGAQGVNGRVIRFTATAAYSADAFVLGLGTRTVRWSFDADMAFRVRYTGPLQPIISTQPADQTVQNGQTATFSVVASGFNLAYQWRKSMDGGATYADIPLATGPSYTTPASASTDNGTRFLVRLTGTNPNSGVQATLDSSSALLTVITPITPPVIPANQPLDLTVPEGGSASFTVTPTGSAPFTYQWRRDNTEIPGPSATAVTYTLNPVQLSDNGARFRVVVTNAAGFAMSRDAILTVNPAPPPPPTLTRMAYQVRLDPASKHQLRSVRLDGTGDLALTDGTEDAYSIVEGDGAGGSQAMVAGGRLVYAGYDSSTGVLRYHSVNPDGTGPADLSDAGAFVAHVGRLGDRLLFQVRRSYGGPLAGAYSVKSDGTGRTAFPADADLRGVALGRVFYNSTVAAGTAAFYSALPDGTGVVKLADGTWDLPVERQVWTHVLVASRLVQVAGNKVLMTRGDVGDQIQVCNPDGSGLVLLATDSWALRSGDALDRGLGRIGYRSGHAMMVAGSRLAYVSYDWTNHVFSVRSVGLDGTAPTFHGTLTAPGVPNGMFAPGYGAFGLLTAAMGNHVFLDGYSGATLTPAGGNPVSEPAVFQVDVSGTGTLTRVASGAMTGVAATSRFVYLLGSAPLAGNGGPVDVVSVLPDGSAPMSLAVGVNGELGLGYGATLVSGHMTMTSDGTMSYPVEARGDRLLYRKGTDATLPGFLCDVQAIQSDGSNPVTLVPDCLARAAFVSHLGTAGLIFSQQSLASSPDVRSHLVQLDGTRLANLGQGPTDGFSLTAGGVVILNHYESNGIGTLWAMNPDGSSLRQLTQPAAFPVAIGVY